MSLQRRTESTTHILDDNDTNLWTNRHRKAKKFIKSAFYFDVFMLVVLVGALILKSYLQERDTQSNSEDSDVSYNPAASDQGVCLSCDYLGPEVKTAETLFDKIEMLEDGGKICCYKSEAYLQTMISRMMNPMITEQRPAIDHEIDERMRWWRKREQSFHMYLDLDQLIKDDKPFPNLIWTHKNDHLGTSFLNGIEFDQKDQTVKVHESGVYFIYSAVTFDFGDVTSVATHTHKVDQFLPITPTTPRPTLLINRFGGSTETKRVYTSFVCGSFTLDAGLVLNCTISDNSLNHVKKSKYSSYFGMFKL